MCGRYTLKTPPDQWGQLLLPILESNVPDSQAWRDDWQPRYNIAPTQNVLAVRVDDGGHWQADYFRWGLIPSWAQELSIGNRMINARAETVDEKRSFASAFKKRRCLVVADGYYEWQKRADGTKQACWITPTDGGVVGFAGLWESNSRATDHAVKSCTIITTSASSDLEAIHDRMPAVLQGAAAEQWMRPECDAELAKSLLVPAEVNSFQVTRVSNYVNNPRHQSSECIQPVE